MNLFLKIALFTIRQKYVLFIAIIILFFNNFNTFEIYYFNNEIEEENDYIQKNNKYFLKKDIVKKFNSYLNICKNGELIDKNKYPLLKNPKISIIVPLYNGGKYLNYSLRTIQNQELKEIEIIIIDDCSTDDSLNYVEKLMIEDPRIRLIKNYRNRKILYSKSIAALNSNGEFILELDQDDMFVRGDLFDIIYNESKKYGLELVQFRDFVKEEFYFKKRTRINFGKSHWIFPKKTFYMEENQLKSTLFKDRNNYLLWGILISSNLYKKSIYNLWEFIINYKLIYNEDYISTTMILSLAHNYKYLNIFGIIHLRHKEATSFNCIVKKEFHLSNIIFPIYLYNYYVLKDPKKFRLIYNYIVLNRFYQTQASLIYRKFFEFNIRNLFYNNYLLINEKKKILDYFNIREDKAKILSSYSYVMNSTEFSSISTFINSINNEKMIDLNSQYIYVNFSKYQFGLNKMIKIKYKKCRRNCKMKENPIISIIIYCNEINYLQKTINSIVKQNDFFSFEIIIIFDYFGKLCLSNNFKYDNIYLVNNQSPKGIMYSYLIGTNFSKGKYILHFQSGYSLIKKNILIKTLNLAKTVDVLEFNLLINKDDNLTNNSFNIYRCSHSAKAYNTNEIKYNENYIEIDQNKELLINKLIKAKYYKAIINRYKLYLHHKKLYNYFDDIIMFLLSKSLCKFKHIDYFGILKNINEVNSLKLNKISNNIEQKVNDTLFYINFLFEHSLNNKEEKKLVYDKYVNLLSLVNNKFLPESSNSIKLLNKFLKCKYINKIDKLELEFFYKSLNN